MDKIKIKIRECYENFNATEQKIASYFLDNSDDIINLNVAELARRCGVSQSALIRFNKKIGFNGLKDLKKYLTADLLEANKNSDGRSPEEYSDIRENDSAKVIFEKISHNNITAITETSYLLDYDALERAIDIIYAADRVDFYGVGASGLVALDAQQKFMRIGKVCNAHPDSHTQLVLASNLRERDVAVIISNSGMTKDCLDISTVAHESKAAVITITKYNQNKLSAQADIALFICSPEINVRSGATSSRIAQLTLIDALFTGVASRNFEINQKTLNRSYRYASLKKVT